ncbi:MAG: tetratricopeptide repeat protein [Myxococcota bacterium]
MKHPLIAVLLFCASTGAAVAQEPQEPTPSNLSDLFSEANTAAQRGMLPEATQRYAELLEAGVRDPDVYFNLATALAKAGDYPGAILNFERALVLRPGDSKAAQNLADAEAALEESRAEAEGEASIRRSSAVGDAIYQPFTDNGLAMAVAVANFLLFAVLGWAWVRRRRGRLFYSLLAASALVLLWSAVGLGVKSDLFRDGPRVVVLGDRVPILEGPDPRASVRGEARGADRGVLLDQDGDFVKLRVIGGEEGWVAAQAVGTIAPNVRAD